MVKSDLTLTYNLYSSTVEVYTNYHTGRNHKSMLLDEKFIFSRLVNHKINF